MAPDEQDILAAAGITDEDFGDTTLGAEPVAPAEAPVEPVEVADRHPEHENRFADGKFAPKAETAPEPPGPQADPAPAEAAPDIASQFNNDGARAAWAAVPAEVKAEVSRRFGEMESGLRTHQERWEPLKRYDEMARAGGTSLAEALDKYVGIEQALAQNPLQGLDLVCRNLGTDLRTIAAHVMGQPAPEKDAEVGQLRQQLQAMAQELNGYRAEKKQVTEKTVTDFFTAHPRANELATDIAFWVQNGFDLEAAYKRAEALNPLPTSPQTAVPTPAAPQTPPANLSISGSPATGSNPAAATPALSGRQATEWAFAQAGL